MGKGRFTTFGVMIAVAGLLACGGGDAADDTTTTTGGADAPAATTPGTASGTAADADAGAGAVDLTNVQLPEGMTPEMVEAGRVAFQTTICYTCHGMDARGTPLAPNMHDSEWINTDGTPEGIEDIIRNGVPTPVSHPAPMPPMGGAQLSDEQIDNLVAYLYAISHAS